MGTEFDNLPPHALKQGARHCLANARRLQKIAGQLSGAGEYGTACSMLVLASEEAAKAIAYYSAAGGLTLDPRGTGIYVKSHNNRLGLAKLLVLVVSYVFPLVESNPDGEVSSLVEEAARRFLRDCIGEQLSPGVREHIDWWNGANLLKQRGFYVDFAGNGWSGPDVLVKADYERASKMVGQIVQAARIARVLDRNRFVKEMMLQSLEGIDATVERLIAGIPELSGSAGDVLVKEEAVPALPHPKPSLAK